MRICENKLLTYRADEVGTTVVERFMVLLNNFPILLVPVRGNGEAVGRPPVCTEPDRENLCFVSDRVPLWCSGGFHLIPTVAKTVLLYDERSDNFLKIVLSLSAKNRVISSFTNRAEYVNNLCENLRGFKIPVPAIHAYGRFRQGGTWFYMMERVQGESLHHLLKAQRERVPVDICRNVISMVADVHRSGYWFRDLRAAHIFLKGNTVSGIIDVDGMRRNYPFRLKNLAKDLAGLYRPGLPLVHDDIIALLRYYMRKMNFEHEAELMRLIKHYSLRRWGSHTGQKSG